MSFSVRSVVVGAVAVFLSGASVAAGVVAPAYARGVTALLLAGCMAGATRLAVATVAAAPRLEPSPPPAVPPTVSLVVTAYDEADALPATIDACTGVDHPDDRFQVVVGYEAASTGATRRCCWRTWSWRVASSAPAARSASAPASPHGRPP